MSSASGDREFATTQWSMVLAAGRGGSPAARLALETLCQLYWPPLYAFLRRSGSSSHDAADCLQGFFAYLLERNDLAGLDQRRGRFRAFLLAALKHYAANVRRSERTLKRGGGRRRIDLDVAGAEAQYAGMHWPAAAPDQAFDRQWALGLLARVRERLGCEQAEAGKRARYKHLEPLLTGDSADSYREVAGRLGIGESAVKVAVHRLRKRFKELLRAEIGQTVAAEDEIDDEIADLFRALQSQAR